MLIDFLNHLFCSSPLRNDNIPIHDMHKHKALRSSLPMQLFVSQNASLSRLAIYRYEALFRNTVA